MWSLTPFELHFLFGAKDPAGDVLDDPLAVLAAANAKLAAKGLPPHVTHWLFPAPKKRG